MVSLRQGWRLEAIFFEEMISMKNKGKEEKKMWGRILGTEECGWCHNEYPNSELYPFFDGLTVSNGEKQITVAPFKGETRLCSACYSEIEKKATEVLNGTRAAEEFAKEYGKSFKIITKWYHNDEDYDNMDWT